MSDDKEREISQWDDDEFSLTGEPEIRINDMSWFFESLGSDTIEAEIDWEERCVILRRHDDE